MTIMTVNDPIQGLSKRLNFLDKELSKKLKNYVPDWWDEELNNSPGAVQQILISLARFADLEIKTVLDDSLPLKFKETVCNYKHASNKEQSQLKTATALVSSAAKIVSQLTTQKYSAFPDALTLRKSLLDAGNSCVSFEALVNYCWQQGVPVLYLPELPASKKMDAVVVDIEGIPVIAITKKCTHESKFLFLLAHEMGHIFHQHLTAGQLLIDEKISGDVDTDEQENQANQFAISLLKGQSHTRYDWDTKNPTFLKSKAKEEGENLNIDAGHIILSWAHIKNNWVISGKALNLLYPNKIWIDFVKNKFLENIDESEAQGDQLDYLYKLMNIEE